MNSICEFTFTFNSKAHLLPENYLISEAKRLSLKWPVIGASGPASCLIGVASVSKFTNVNNSVQKNIFPCTQIIFCSFY